MLKFVIKSWKQFTFTGALLIGIAVIAHVTQPVDDYSPTPVAAEQPAPAPAAQPAPQPVVQAAPSRTVTVDDPNAYRIDPSHYTWSTPTPTFYMTQPSYTPAYQPNFGSPHWQKPPPSETCIGASAVCY